MEPSDDSLDLTGKMLVAMPGMGDPRFAFSVIFLCAHSGEGAMGLIVNRPADGMRLADLFEQLEIRLSPDSDNAPVYFGGPVEHGRGFVLHSAEYQSSISTLDVCDRFRMTATLDILEDIAAGNGPRKALMALGYSGWGPGQLEAEIGENGWLVCEASEELVFDLEDGEKWRAAMKSLGIDPLLLSDAAGHA